jgi:hypothetical protein
MQKPIRRILSNLHDFGGGRIIFVKAALDSLTFAGAIFFSPQALPELSLKTHC